jgi:nucleoside-diphosphate-sugar epimerase
MDMTRAKQILGFQARTLLADGIHETIEWYLANTEITGKKYSVFRERSYI